MKINEKGNDRNILGHEKCLKIFLKFKTVSKTFSTFLNFKYQMYFFIWKFFNNTKKFNSMWQTFQQLPKAFCDSVIIFENFR